ncbi:sugar transporter [Cystobasidium minutum MCA 4210]|uniref:sugar transporter n=1 Tax=Cystobasidium minutum MCA 4210 TaxID=1397322 RepID=UPI0034CE65E7|eukprot:jgi/Rhomi1/171847/fgenesh1_kg.4_\
MADITMKDKGNDASKFDSRQERVAEHAIEDVNLRSNPTARLQNPLAGIPRSTLLSNVEEFVQEWGLESEADTFRKGALLAQKPHGYRSIPEISPEEGDIIEREHTHRWSHPATLYLTIALCSIGAAVQGWDQTGSNGANLSFPLEFGIAGTGRDTWLVGVVNAAPYLASAGLGCWLSDPLNRMFGRRGTIFITAIILIVTPIASGFTQNWQQLFIVRLILGLGMGAKGSTVPILAAENAPATIRGALVMTWQFWTAFGIFLGYAANVVCLKFGGNNTWRYQLGSAFIPALPLMFIYLVPESPRWLMRKKRYAAAYRSLVRLRHSKLQAARDLYYVHVQLELESQIVKGDNFFKRLIELFTIPRLQRATLASGTVMLAQQMCGINIIAFYSSTIFVQANYTDEQALYASLGFGAVNFLFAIPAFYTIDTFGRRTLLLFTFPQMAWSLLAAGLCFLIPESAGTTRIGLIALFIYIFAAWYSPGEGPVPFTYSAEVFPLSHREVGMAWAVTVCLGFAAVLSISLPRMLDVMGAVGVFCFYAGLNIVAFFLIFFFVPETKQRTLEELDQIFAVPTGTFIKYNTSKALPYFIKRYVLCNKRETLEPLYQMDMDLDGEETGRNAKVRTRHLDDTEKV